MPKCKLILFLLIAFIFSGCIKNSSNNINNDSALVLQIPYTKLVSVQDEKMNNGDIIAILTLNVDGKELLCFGKCSQELLYSLKTKKILGNIELQKSITKNRYKILINSIKLRQLCLIF